MSDEEGLTLTTMPAATTFGYWKSQFPGLYSDLRVRVEPVRSDCVFLRHSFAMPLPSGAGFTAWQWFEDATQAAGYLRHVLLHDFFSIWLARDEWDEQPEERVELSVLLDRAASLEPPSRFQSDIPLMRELVAELDGAFSRDQETVLATLETVEKRFNDRWGWTPTYNMGFQVFPNLASAASWLLDDESKREERSIPRLGPPPKQSRQEWLADCARGDSDPAAAARVRDRFDANEES